MPNVQVEAGGAGTSTIYRAMSPILSQGLREREGVYKVFDKICSKIPMDGDIQWMPLYDRIAPWTLFPEHSSLPESEMHAYIHDIQTDRFGRGVGFNEYDAIRLNQRMPEKVQQKAMKGLAQRYGTFYNKLILNSILGNTAEFGTKAIKTTNIYGHSLFSASNPFDRGGNGNVVAGVSWTPEGIYETFADIVKPRFFNFIDNYGEPFWDAVKMAADEEFLLIYPAERDAAFKRAFKLDYGPSVQTFPMVAYSAEPRKELIEMIGKPVLFAEPRLNGTDNWYVIRIDAEAPLIIMGMTSLEKSEGSVFGAPNANFQGENLENKSFIEMRVTMPGDTNYQKTGDFLVSVRAWAGTAPGISQSGILVAVP